MEKKEPRRNLAGALDAGGEFGYTPPLSVAHQLRDTYRIFAKSLLFHIAEHNVTMGQWYIFKELWGENGLTQRQLSEKIGIMEPTAVNTIKIMEKRGLIRKRRNSKDRRKTNIFLTKKGKALCQTIMPFASQVVSTAVKDIPAVDLQMLRGLLEKMKNNLEAEKGGN